MPAATSMRDASLAGAQRAIPRGAGLDRLAIAAFMVVSVASGFAGGSGYDTARDVAEAYAIRHLHALPLHGPLLAGALHLGPIWFYLLALPLALHESWLSVALFAAALGSLQFPLAYAAGRRLLDRRLGLLWCALLALPGWGTFELVGFGHVTAVRVCTMLVLYALIRLAQDRRPGWLVLAAGALALAIHAHPSTAALVLVVAAVALFVLRDLRTLILWGSVSLFVAALPFAPRALEQLLAPSTGFEHTDELFQGMVRVENLAHLPALLYGVLVRGPQVVTGAFFAWVPGVSSAIWTAVMAIEIAAGIGLIAAFRRHRALILIGLCVTGVVAATIAWIRPVTPFYMTFAMLPPLAGLGAVGLYRLCELTGSRAGMTAGALISAILALLVATVGGIAQAISSGEVTMPLVSRLDVKQDDAAPAPTEPWLPAYAVDESGALLCGEQRTIVLHGTYAYLEDSYFGLDHRLRCGSRNIRLLGAEPSSASHLVGLAKPLWAALGWQPVRWVGGLGIAPAARVIGPAAGYAVPDGTLYPPYRMPVGPVRTLQLEAVAPRNAVVVISIPYLTWTPAPVLRVTANGEPQASFARDAVSLLYACRSCASDAAVTWRVEIDSATPERVDIVMLTPPAPR
ncbi:MAG: glycosyltransferase family 39 protein [Betaproteobacteria bacterium]